MATEMVIEAEPVSGLSTGATPPSTVVVGSSGGVSGSVSEGTETPKTPEAPSTGTPTEPSSTSASTDAFIVGGHDMGKFAQEYEKDGKLSDASYKELADAGFSRELVDAYIDGVQRSAEASGGELAGKEVDAILQEVGGQEEYDKVMQWAVTHLTEEEQEAYDRAVTNPDPAVARFVVQGLFSRYEREHGRAPSLVTGTRVSATEAARAQGFSDRSEMIKAMSDKRYGVDPEYTRRVEQQVLSSGLMKGGSR